MARTLHEIHAEAEQRRSEYLQLTEFENTSKMSIIDAFTWCTSACIWTCENLQDVFKVDLAKILQNRINGTPAYYCNAMLKYQSGDSLEMNEAGTAFSYPVVNASKRIITKASYSEVNEEGFFDKHFMLKIAKGLPGAYSRIEGDELLAIRTYLAQILFAGMHATVVSRNGDVLIPRVTVYHDGEIPETEVYSNIEKSLNECIANIGFDSAVYVQRIIDAIQKAEHVKDVYINSTDSDMQGIFVAQYDDDGLLIATEFDANNNPISYEKRINRLFTPNSGYIKQSTRTEGEANLQLWKESIVLKIEQQ